MALTKQTVVDLVEVLRDGRLQVREATEILEDGVLISRTFHRDVVDLEDDVSNRGALVKDIARAVWTPERIAARRNVKAEEAARVGPAPDPGAPTAP